MANTIFSQKELEYIRSQRLARIATTAAAPSSVMSSNQEGQGEDTSIQPDVVPVGFDFDGDYFYVGGMNILKSTKYKNVLKNNKVAIVIDDLKSVDPWDPRGIKVYGTADTVNRQGGYMEGTGHPNPSYIRVKPDKKWSWGIEEPVFVEGRFNVKRARRD
jgi:pyridoxamine 5'-phosphate oxidase family protein